jgi:hypothetical protein
MKQLIFVMALCMLLSACGAVHSLGLAVGLSSPKYKAGQCIQWSYPTDFETHITGYRIDKVGKKSYRLSYAPNYEAATSWTNDLDISWVDTDSDFSIVPCVKAGK